MREELEQKLVQRWPTWFRAHGDFRRTAMTRGFEHGDGWFDIVWRLCEDLEPLVMQLETETDQRFEVLQVKEKFGGLRFSVNHRTDAIYERIQAARNESYVKCEVCGKRGSRREDNQWMTTRCTEHAEA